MENIIIRNITENDIPSVTDIKINGWKAAYKGLIDDSVLNSMNRDEMIEMRKKDYKDNRFIVAELNNEIAGFCVFTDSNKYTPDIQGVDCELLALYVKPELKYCGIGTKLFAAAADELKEKNKHKMILWCLKNNEPSRKFYEAHMNGSVISDISEREIEINGKNYREVAFVYDI